jgi:hypothetical protein
MDLALFALSWKELAITLRKEYEDAKIREKRPLGA